VTGGDGDDNNDEGDDEMRNGRDGMASEAAVVEHVVCLEMAHGLVGQLLLSAAAAVLLNHLPTRDDDVG
jgi:hypothetical protein